MAIGLGAIIGAGIFVAIGPAVDVAGVWTLLGIGMAALVALFNALSSAQLAAAYPVSGGTYAYGRRLLHPLAGFIAGWIFVAAAIAADSAIALGFASYLAVLLPAVPLRGIAVVLAIAATLLNYRGLGYSARVNTWLVMVKVGALLAFIALGAVAVDGAHLRPAAPFAINPVLQAAAILFFAYTGYARIATLGEEVKDPERTIPRAILMALGIAAGLYFGVLLVTLGILGPGTLAASTAPLATAMQAAGSSAGVIIIAGGALVATATVSQTDLLGISRVIFAMARNRELPSLLAAIHPRFSSPHYAVLASGAVVILLTAWLPLRGLVEAGSFGLLVYYGITNLAAIVLPNEQRRYHRAWAVLGMLTCFTLALFLPWRTILYASAVIVAGALYYWTVTPRRNRRRTP